MNSLIPQDYLIGNLKSQIETALKKHDSNFCIQGKITAIGPKSGNKYQQIISRRKYFEFVQIPIENMCGDTRSCNILVIISRSKNGKSFSQFAFYFFPRIS